MKKKYTVQFKTLEGARYEYEFLTSDLEKTLKEYMYNKEIADYKILEESNSNTKQMLFG